jgi:hypothetical protein
MRRIEAADGNEDQPTWVKVGSERAAAAAATRGRMA